MYIISQVRRCITRHRREDKACQFQVDTPLIRKPMQLAQHWRDMFVSSGSGEKPSSQRHSAFHVSCRAVLTADILGRQCRPSKTTTDIVDRQRRYRSVYCELYIFYLDNVARNSSNGGWTSIDSLHGRNTFTLDSCYLASTRGLYVLLALISF